MAQSATAHAHAEIRNPGPLAVSGVLRGTFLVFALVGTLSFVLTLRSDPTRAWMNFVHNHFFFMSLAVGGLFFASIQWLTGAMWSAPVRRISEAFTAYLPVALVLFVILTFGISHLYTWSHMQHVKGNLVLEGKTGYLNTTFFIVRNIVALLLWIFFARLMVGNSIAQDTTREYRLTVRNRGLAPAFLILFALTFTMSSFDLLMSLAPEWFSTMFGVYCFAGLFYSVLALTAIVTVYLQSIGKLDGILNENHLHDLGKFMFAFTVFWAYIGFSQFMLIWYANLPEETGYFIRRLHGGWAYISLFLIIGKFMAPFFFLLPREAKRNPRVLVMIGIFMLIAQWIDVLWMVQPQFLAFGPRIGLSEFGILLGFLGVFGLSVSWFLGRHNVVAIGDPRLQESVFHHHQ